MARNTLTSAAAAIFVACGGPIDDDAKVDYSITNGPLAPSCNNSLSTCWNSGRNDVETIVTRNCSPWGVMTRSQIAAQQGANDSFIGAWVLTCRPYVLDSKGTVDIDGSTGTSQSVIDVPHFPPDAWSEPMGYSPGYFLRGFEVDPNIGQDFIRRLQTNFGRINMGTFSDYNGPAEIYSPSQYSPWGGPKRVLTCPNEGGLRGVRVWLNAVGKMRGLELICTAFSQGH